MLGIRCWLVVLLSLLVFEPASAIFCSSYCVAETVCWNTNNQSCMGCAQSLFMLEPNHTTGQCDLLNHTQVQPQPMQIVAYDLASSIDLSSFQTNNPTPYNCTAAYPLSGSYSSGDYLAKTYDNLLPASHYYLVVRFNMAFMGSWLNTDMLAATVDGFQKVWNYSCNTNQAICTTSDCIRQYEVQRNHSSTSLSLNITATIASSPPTQSWGIREILIAVRICDSSCLTCYGPKANQCYSCQPNYFILGTACVVVCPHFTVRSVAVCLEDCPDSYYSSQMDCEMCHPDCATCRGPESSDCITSFDQSISKKFSQNLQLWIFVLVLVVLVVAGMIWYFLNRRKKLQELEQREREVREKMLASSLNITINELPESKVFEFKKKSLKSELVINERKESEQNPKLQEIEL